MKNQYKQQTRVAVVGEGSEHIFNLTLSTLDFLGKTIDAVKFDETISHNQNDFVLLALDKNNDNICSLEPTIAVVTDYSEHYPDFLNSITSGGIVIYNQENEKLTKAIQSAEKYFRKIPFTTPDHQENGEMISLETDLGLISIKSSTQNAQYIEATRLLCQQLGIQEEEFYEALLYFAS